MNLLNGILIDAPPTSELISGLNVLRWRLRTHVHDEGRKCEECLLGLMSIGQHANAIFDHIDMLEEKMAAWKRAMDKIENQTEK